MKIKIILLTVLLNCVIGNIGCTNESASDRKRAISELEKKYYNHPGVGPISELKLDETIDKIISDEGEKLFQSKCISCHQMSAERMIGPGLKGITKRRRPEWIMNQMLNPIGMVKEDSLSKELFLIYQVQMIDMGLSKEQARAILEYFRSFE